MISHVTLELFDARKRELFARAAKAVREHKPHATNSDVLIEGLRALAPEPPAAPEETK